METVKDTRLAANLAALSNTRPHLALQVQLEDKRQVMTPAVRPACDWKELEAIELLYLFGWGQKKDVAAFVEWATGQTH